MFGITHLELMIYFRRNQLVDCTSRDWKLYQSQILSKDADIFLLISFFFRCYSHFFFFWYNKSVTWFVFFYVNIFFKCKLNANGSINDHSLYLCSMLLETSSLLSQLFCSVNFDLIWLIEFQNKTNIEIIGFQLMNSVFALDS